MHALDLNLLQNHIRTVFQIDIKYPGGNGLGPASNASSSPLSREQQASLQRCIQTINLNEENMAMTIALYPRSILYKICVDNNILGQGHNVVVGTKWILANNIAHWVSLFTVHTHQTSNELA